MIVPGVGTKLDGSLQRSRDRLTVGHPEFEDHTQHIMVLADQYAFGGTDHFHLEEVIRSPKSFMSNDAASWSFTRFISPRSATVMTKSSTYSKILTGPSRPFQMNMEESDLAVAKPIQRSCCVIFAFQARGACFIP